MLVYYVPGQYENPITPEGRARTIAAFHLAQGNTDVLSNAEMRGDVLRHLMSPRAISWWLNEKKWLELSRKQGRIRMLRLTELGIQTCADSLTNSAKTNTTLELVNGMRRAMSQGGPGYTRREFNDLPVSA
jgi:hypothetical protein